MRVNHQSAQSLRRFNAYYPIPLRPGCGPISGGFLAGCGIQDTRNCAVPTEFGRINTAYKLAVRIRGGVFRCLS